jgi:hypothetical protein
LKKAEPKQDLGNPARKAAFEKAARKDNKENNFLDIKGARGAEALALKPSH